MKQKNLIILIIAVLIIIAFIFIFFAWKNKTRRDYCFRECVFKQKSNKWTFIPWEKACENSFKDDVCFETKEQCIKACSRAVIK